MRYEDIYNSTGMLKELGKRIKQYRISYPMTQKDLSEKTGVSVRSISRFETGEDIQVSNLIKILDALELKNNMELLVPDPEKRPSYYFRENKQRYRASSRPTNRDSKWKWGDEQ